MSLSERKKLFTLFHDKLLINDSFLTKNSLLGEGVQGKIFKFCDKTGNCTAIKKMYIDEDAANYVNKPFTKNAFRHENYIELGCSQLTNQLILQGVSPHFILNYSWKFKERSGICDDIYPFSSFVFNEYIDCMTLEDWSKKNHDEYIWYNAFFQIISGILALQKFFDMYHLDLHSKNILVKKIPKGGYWKYTINEIDYYLPNIGYQFYINDFGFSWVSKFKSIVSLKNAAKIVHEKDYSTFNQIFDIVVLFKDITKKNNHSLSSDLKKDIRKFIKISDNMRIIYFYEAFSTLFSNYTVMPTNVDVIDTFNLDIKLKRNMLPTFLR